MGKKNGSWISSDLILQLRTDALLKSLCLIHFFLCSQAYMRKEGFIDLAHLHPVKKDHFGVTLPKCLSCGGLINVVLSDQKSQDDCDVSSSMDENRLTRQNSKISFTIFYSFVLKRLSTILRFCVWMLLRQVGFLQESFW